MILRPVQLPSNGRWPVGVDVWHVAIPSSIAVQNYPYLDVGEYERAARYRQVADRIRFVVVRSALRELLGKYLRVEPADLRFSPTSTGRLELSGFMELSFNVSRADEHALIVISQERRVGVDIEFINIGLDWRDLTALVCTNRELQAVSKQRLELQAEYFFRCWTAKEAVLKMLGLGITGGLLKLTVELAAFGPQRLIMSEGEWFADTENLQYCWLTDIPTYMGCVAYSDSGHNRCQT